MSNVTNLAHDLVAMAKAMEDLPKVQAENDRLNVLAETRALAIQHREERIAFLKSEIDSLNEKIRRTEAERDDAELRFLELDEKANKAHAVLTDIEGLVRNAAVSLEVAKPKPETDLVPTLSGTSPTVVSVPADPTVASPTIPDSLVGENAQAKPVEAPSAAPEQGAMPPLNPVPMPPSEALGQSVPNPTQDQTGNYNHVTQGASSPQSAEGVSVMPDPIGSGVSTTSPSDEAPSYANEPSPKWGNAWFEWSRAMNQRFGEAWPARGPDLAF